MPGSTLKRKLMALICLSGIVGCAPSLPPSISLDQAQTQVVPYLRTFQPAGTGAHPTVIFLHGASDKSWYSVYDDMVQRFVANGYGIVFLDMYSGRGSNGQAARSGHLLPKQTAGDLMIALDWAKRQHWVDADRVYAVGTSFGGATIMDAMVYADPAKVPLGVSANPVNELDGLRAAVLWAPLCIGDVMGFNIVASLHEPFYANVPILALIPEEDQVSSPEICKSILNRNRTADRPVDIIAYPATGHSFMIEADEYGAQMADYDAAKAEDAWKRTFAFLAGYGGPAQRN
ncbi:prolyl oligopeptidase family serine peptidase [Alphaproteobacteria bacterium HT1-32]|nr:prolyl oligopeptidase family serine peptidase [Alphaproteobacteria bacterium HT1-32]